jgi:hypothetical protein
MDLITKIAISYPHRIFLAERKVQRYTICPELSDLQKDQFQFHILNAKSISLNYNHPIINNNEKSLTIHTCIDGEKETSNTAYENDFIMCGPKNELYVMKEENIKKKYNILPIHDSTNGISCLETKNDPRRAIELLEEDDFELPYVKFPIRFQASFGSEMIANKGDFIVFEDGDGFGACYRVEKEIFEQTYIKIN